MVQYINNKSNGGNVVLKVHMANAYDRVDWRFLVQVMKTFGFLHEACQLISECVKTFWFLIMMNDTYKDFFSSPNGGLDKAIHYLHVLILTEEVLSRLS